MINPMLMQSAVVMSTAMGETMAITWRTRVNFTLIRVSAYCAYTLSESNLGRCPLP